MNCCSYAFIVFILGVVLLIALPIAGILLVVWVALLLLVLIG